MDRGIWFDLKFPPDTTAHNVPTTAWKKFPSNSIPPLFTLNIIEEYLTKCSINLTDATDSDSEEDSPHITIVKGQKSWRRGRISYASGHVQDIEDNSKDVHYFIRSNVTASYKDIVHKVSITLNFCSSKVVDAICTCKAAACKSCSHVVGLLFALEDYTTLYGFEPTASTSKLMTWNMGRQRGKYPKRVLEATYPNHARLEQDRKRYFEASFSQNISSNVEEMFLKSLQTLSQPTMFEFLFQFKYENYVINADELAVLKMKVNKMIQGLIPQDVGPIVLSVEQNSTQWLLERRVRITASKAKSFFTAKKLDKLVDDHLWKTNDLGNIRAINYGRNNESKAFDDYKNLTGFDVCKAGFVINKKFPGLGCSPDGLVVDKDGSVARLIEIKCPLKLRDIHPNKLATIDGQNMCYTLDNNKKLKIKRNHQYYYQVTK